MAIKQAADYMEIDDFLWGLAALADHRCHTTDPNSHGKMAPLKRANATARGAVPTTIDEDDTMVEEQTELLP
eukprot:4066835-Amphidinium_carterae.1